MKNNADLKEKYLEYYRKVPMQKFAAAYIGKSEETIIRWRKADADFDNCVSLAKANFVSEKINKIRSNEWILERVIKGDFSPRQEYTGAGGKELPQPIITVQHVSGDHSDSEDKQS